MLRFFSLSSRSCIFFGLFWLWVTPPSAHSALPQKSTSFFRRIDSPIPSGQQPRAELLKNQVSSITINEFLVESHKNDSIQKQRVSSGQLITDLHVSEWALTKKTTPLFSGSPTSPQWSLNLEAGQHVQLLRFENEWSEVFIPALKKKFWLQWPGLKSNQNEVGLLYAIIATPFKAQARLSSPALFTLAPGARVRLLGQEGPWYKIQDGSKVGYAHSSYFISKIDFALYFSERKNNWYPKSQYKKTFLLNFKGLFTDPNLAIIGKANDHFKLQERVRVIEKTSVTWAQSKIADHGLVWWKPSEEPDDQSRDKKLSIDELLKRDIYSVAFHPKNEKMGLVSAQGIYFTLDGLNWQKLQDFENNNWPVHILPDGTWVIGSYKSSNQGRSFSEFFAWEKLTRIVQAALTHPPRYLKMVSLDVKPSNELELVLDTGYKRLRLVSFSNGSSWIHRN